MVKKITEKHLGGRPTKYTPELLEKAYLYVQGAWKDGTDAIPSHIGLKKFLGISRETLYKWRKENNKKEFADLLDECMDEQQNELIQGGLIGRLNSNITKLVLGKHGFHDKQDIETPNGVTIIIGEKDAGNL